MRAGAEQALVRAAVVRDGRSALLEVEINPGRSNRARVNRSPLPRARELVGLVRTVLFSPEDLALVKGDPSERRRFLDDLLVLRTPRLAGVRADYDRVLQAAQLPAQDRRRRAPRLASRGRGAGHPRTCGTSTSPAPAPSCSPPGSRWSTRCGPTSARPTRPWPAGPRARTPRWSTSRPSTSATATDRERRALLAALAERRGDELDRGISLVGPHRDELLLTLGNGGRPGSCRCRGYASHGESWSFALALRLASYDLLRADGDDPILILDDVFAELDTERRDQLAELVAGAEQVLVTAAVAADVPAALAGVRFDVGDGEVTRSDDEPDDAD